MTSPAELYFLYGDAYDEVAKATGPELWFLNFAHADLTTDATIFFALATLLGVMAMFWGDLVPWILAVAMRLVSPMLSVVAAAGSLAMQLVRARSLQERGIMLHRFFQDRVKKPILDWRAARLVCVGLKWYFPAQQPARMALRHAITFFCCMAAYVAFLRPLSQWLIGIADVLRAENRGLSSYCEGVRQGWVTGRYLLPQRFRGYHCPGEETGLWLRVTFEDLWRSMPRLIDLDGEIPHFRILAHAFAGVSLVILVALLLGSLAQFLVSRRVDTPPSSSGRRADNNVDEKRVPKSPVRNPWQEEVFTLIRRYEGILTEKDQLLSATTQKLGAAEQRNEDGLAQFQQLTDIHAKCAEKLALLSRESTDVAALRRRLAETEAQITLAHMRARWSNDDATAREQALRGKVAKLEQQLQAEKERQTEDRFLDEIESLRTEIQTRDEQLAFMEQHRAAAEKGLDAHIQELTIKNEELQTRNHKLVATEERLTIAHEEIDAERRRAADRIHELEAHVQDLTATNKELQTRNDQLASMERRLATADKETDSERRRAADRIHELEAHVQDLTAKNEEFQASRDNLSQMCSSLATVQQERDDAFQQIVQLQNELESTRTTAEAVFLESQESLAQARALESELQQSMHDLQHACDSSLAQERAASASARARIAELEAEVADLQTQRSLAMRDAERAQQRAAATAAAAAAAAAANPGPQTVELKAEIADLQTQRGLAMRDAERAQKRADDAEKTITILETRLSKHENAARGSLQDIPKRQMGNIGSISTALAESEVKVAQQQNQISDLQRQIEEFKKGASGPSDDAVAEEVQKLRGALDQVRRERTEDQVRWDKRTRELEEDNQKLRVSLSNAEAVSRRRAGGRRPPGLRRAP
ncbi:uncharacterized protein ACLA_090150 [Aspergillus clavatus NRRL 1]|uniref:Integral membrane protein n=1 Tax=Aspergillus clavatus (strain ATCC 1007 / CBS 513.65 / DSM 816 / NCTC 3887 / NRRL 1 / QM 1276 / 107) TaxID=344612 RepID=A1CEM3_ASPCL|nr:uncharacterized protein ACLA_090150 [Aspergillus clavatus NRRL 1]EAW11322.1 integral membrane protein [Aspergillus clavatus NRRL 1]